MNSRNKVDSTRCFQDAKIFESATKAGNFAACLPGIFRNAGYEVVNADVFIEAQTEEECGHPQEHEEDSKPLEINEEFLDLEYLLANVQVFEEFIKEFKEQRPLLEKEQIRMERAIMDLEHAAELCELDVRRGYMLYKMLHKARKRRRACKDAVTIIAELENRVDKTSKGSLTVSTLQEKLRMCLKSSTARKLIHRNRRISNFVATERRWNSGAHFM